MKSRSLACLLALLAACLFTARAGVIYQLNSGSLYDITGGVGTGRGIGLQANSAFSIASIGIQSDLDLMSFDAVVFSSPDGHSAGSQLAIASAVLGGGGFGFYDIPINYSFTAGNYYVLLWRPSVSNSEWEGPGGLAYYSDGGLPRTVGPVTLIDGTEGFNAGSFGNSLHPNLRIDTDAAAPIPEPASLALLIGGLSLLAWRKLRP